MKTISAIFVANILLATAGTTHAALYDRGNGMIYDSAQNITWMQDANYAKTSGYNNTGTMTWFEARDWSSSLIYQGISGWRLPSAKLVGDYEANNDCGLDSAGGLNIYDGSCDRSYNNTRSELGHLYFELGNLALANTKGKYLQSGYGFFKTTFTDADSGKEAGFLNTFSDVYWENEDSTAQQYSTYAWTFYTFNGFQNLYGKYATINHAWAVHDGDVAAVPVPAAAWLLGSGLIGLAGMTRRRK